MHKGKTTDSWNRIAYEYSKQRPTSPAALMESPIVMKMLGDVKGKLILDAGCAGGYYSFKLQELGAQVIGVDFSENMIRYAQTEQKSRGVKNPIIFKQGDILEIEKLQLAPASFDGIVCASLLNNVENLSKALNVLNTIMKDNGTLVISIPHPVSSASTKEDEKLVIEDWFTVRKKESTWIFGDKKVVMEFYHRPLSDYLNALVSNGFKLTEIAEPRSPENVKPRSEIDRVLFERRRKLPSFLILNAIKEEHRS